MVTFLRWLSVPFACVLGAVAGTFVLHWAMLSVASSVGNDAAIEIEKTLTMAASAYGWLVAGTYAAPSHRKNTVWCLAGLWIVIVVAAVWKAQELLPNIQITPNPISVVVTMAAAWITIRHFWEEDKTPAESL